MKSIDEAIKHCEEVAEEQEWQAYKSVSRTYDERMSCEECAKEHRQLAEWLRTLKAYGEARKVIEGTIEELKKSGDDTYIKGLELAEQIIHELVDEEEYEWDTQ